MAAAADIAWADLGLGAEDENLLDELAQSAGSLEDGRPPDAGPPAPRVLVAHGADVHLVDHMYRVGRKRPAEARWHELEVVPGEPERVSELLAHVRSGLYSAILLAMLDVRALPLEAEVGPALKAFCEAGGALLVVSGEEALEPRRGGVLEERSRASAMLRRLFDVTWKQRLTPDSVAVSSAPTLSAHQLERWFGALWQGGLVGALYESIAACLVDVPADEQLLVGMPPRVSLDACWQRTVLAAAPVGRAGGCVALCTDLVHDGPCARLCYALCVRAGAARETEWSVRAHAAFPRLARARARALLLVGAQLDAARRARGGACAGSLLDAWVAAVLPRCVDAGWLGVGETARVVRGEHAGRRCRVRTYRPASADGSDSVEVEVGVSLLEHHHSEHSEHQSEHHDSRAHLEPQPHADGGGEAGAPAGEPDAAQRAARREEQLRALALALAERGGGGVEWLPADALVAAL